MGLIALSFCGRGTARRGQRETGASESFPDMAWLHPMFRGSWALNRSGRCLALEAPLPTPTLHPVLGIGQTRDLLVQGPHEPGQIVQPGAIVFRQRLHPPEPRAGHRCPRR